MIRNKKKKLSKKFFDDQIFQKSQFSICALHEIKFLMDFNGLRCTSETLRKISFRASGSHAKITYVHIHTYVPGTNRAFTSLLHEKVSFRTCVAWAMHKKSKNEVEKTITLPIALRESSSQTNLTIKYIKLWSFHLTYNIHAFQFYGTKFVKNGFSNNPIIETKKKLTFQGVFM